MQASRISTFLHMNGMPGETSEQVPRRCPSPCTTFFSPGNGSAPASWVHCSPWREGSAVSELHLGNSWAQTPAVVVGTAQAGRLPFPENPWGLGTRDGEAEAVSCLLPWSVAWYLLILKDLLGPGLLLTPSLPPSQM